MKPSRDFRPVRHPLRLVLERGWTYGTDPRRRDGITLISPRGTIFETRHLRGALMARPYHHYQLAEA
jgi:hypothetical protein